MSVYLFTYHGFGTWLPDHQRGYTQRNQGYQPTNDSLANAYRSVMKHEVFYFAQPAQQRLIKKLQAIAETESYRLHGVATDRTHLHTIVSWRDEQLPFVKVRGRIKNLLSLDLSQAAGITGRPWFSREGSRKQVSDEQHFNYLMKVYLPKHQGWQWYEDRGWVEPHST